MALKNFYYGDLSFESVQFLNDNILPIDLSSQYVVGSVRINGKITDLDFSNKYSFVRLMKSNGNAAAKILLASFVKNGTSNDLFQWSDGEIATEAELQPVDIENAVKVYNAMIIFVMASGSMPNEKVQKLPEIVKNMLVSFGVQNGSDFMKLLDETSCKLFPLDSFLKNVDLRKMLEIYQNRIHLSIAGHRFITYLHDINVEDLEEDTPERFLFDHLVKTFKVKEFYPKLHPSSKAIPAGFRLAIMELICKVIKNNRRSYYLNWSSSIHGNRLKALNEDKLNINSFDVVVSNMFKGLRIFSANHQPVLDMIQAVTGKRYNPPVARTTA